MKYFKDTIQDLHNFLKPELNTLKLTITKFLDSDVNIVKDIISFIENHPGKFLRPILTILVAKLFNYSDNHHISLAAAIECIHVATLLHDDVIDNSKMRHNFPTVNLIWDNTTAILMGDFLFSKAFQLMVTTNNIEVLKILSESSSVITQGELKQLENIANIKITLHDYYSIIKAKTACLFQSATHVGALISTNKKNYIELLKETGLYFGIAYQILDDVNDYSFEQQNIGKYPGDDLKEGKVTLPLIIALSKMDTKEKMKVEKILKKENKTQQDINKVLLLLNKYNALTESKKYAQKYVTLALNRLSFIEESLTKEKLINLITSINRLSE